MAENENKSKINDPNLFNCENCEKEVLQNYKYCGYCGHPQNNLGAKPRPFQRKTSA